MRSADPNAATPAPGPISNFATLGSSEVLARAIGFYATAIVARKLGVDAFGYLGFAIAIISYFGVALNVGFADIGAREVARDPSNATHLASDATAMRLLSALAGIVAITAMAFVMDLSAVQRIVLLLSSATLIPIALDTTWVYRGLSRNRIPSLALLLAQVAYLAGVAFLVGTADDVARVPLIQFAGDVLAALLLLGLLFGRRMPRPSIAGGVVLVRQSGFVTVSRLLRTLIVTFDVMLLGLIAGSRDVGLYTAAYRVCMLVTTISVATHIVFLPGVTRAAMEGIGRVNDVLRRSLSLTSAVILPLTAGGIVLAEPLLVFFFGEEYAPGAAAFRVLLGSIALLSVHGTTHNVFIALHETRKEAVIFGMGALLNVVLNLLLIPPYGLIGAASATIATEAIILVASAAALERFGLRIAVSAVKLPIVASAVMSAALFWSAGRVPVWLAVPAGGLIYAAVFSAIGGIRQLRDSTALITASPD